MYLNFTYVGDVYGILFEPTYLSMIANEYRKLGHEVELVRTPFVERATVEGVPADSIFSEEYQALIDKWEELSGEKFNYLQLEATDEHSLADIRCVVTAFGCKNKCHFCTHSRLTYIERPMDLVLKELKHVTDTSYYFEFIDNNIMANKDRFFDIISHIPSGMEWGGVMNIDDYSELQLLYLYKHGLRKVYLGLETFNKDDLRLLGKPYVAKGIDPKEFILRLKKIGFDVCVFTLAGTPNTTPREFREMTTWLTTHDVKYIINRLHLNNVPQFNKYESPTDLEVYHRAYLRNNKQQLNTFLAPYLLF